MLTFNYIYNKIILILVKLINTYFYRSLIITYFLQLFVNIVMLKNYYIIIYY